MSICSVTETTRDERELFTAAKAGDRDAFWLLFNRCKDQAAAGISLPRRFTNVYSRDDIIHQAGIEACRDIAQVRDLNSFPHWLRQIMLHLLYKMLEKIDRSAINWSSFSETYEIGMIEEKNGGHDVLKSLCDQEGIECLHRLIDELPVNDQMILKAYYFLGLNYKEEAEFLRFGDIAEFRTIDEKTVSRRNKAILARLGLRMKGHRDYLVPFVTLDSLLKIFGPKSTTIAEPTLLSSVGLGIKWLCSTMVLPLLWLTALFIAGNTGIRSLVQETSGTCSRVWLIKRMFTVYSLVILNPAFMMFSQWLSVYLYPGMSREARGVLGSGIMAVWFLGIAVFLLVSWLQFRRLERFPGEVGSLSVDAISDLRRSLLRRIKREATITGALIIASLIFFGFGFFNPGNNSIMEIIRRDFLHFLILFVFWLGYHLQMTWTVLQMARKVEEVYPPVYLERGRKTAIWLFTAACIVVMIIPILLQPFSGHTISMFDWITLTVFGLWWIAVVIRNIIKSPAWGPVFTAIVLQYLVLIVAAHL